MHATVKALPPEIYTTLFQACLNRKTEPQDTHPSLKDRIDNLEQIIETPNFTDKPAFPQILSSEDQDLWNQTVNHWLKIRWTYEISRFQKIKEQRKNMEEKGIDTPFTLLYEILPYKELMEAAHSQRQQLPKDPDILFLLGKEKLYLGDKSGLRMILSAFEQNDQFRNLVRYEIITYFKHYQTKEELEQFCKKNPNLMEPKTSGRQANRQFGTNRSLFNAVDYLHTGKIDLVDICFGSLSEISDVFLEEIKKLINQFPLVRKARLLSLSDCYILIIHYRTGWQRKKYDEVRRDFVESATYTAPDHRPHTLFVLSESQLIKKHKLRNLYRFYGQRIK